MVLKGNFRSFGEWPFYTSFTVFHANTEGPHSQSANFLTRAPCYETFFMLSTHEHEKSAYMSMKKNNSSVILRSVDHVICSGKHKHWLYKKTEQNIFSSVERIAISECLNSATSKTKVGAQWLSGRVLDSRPKGRGFEPHRRHCVVVLEQDTFILA